MEPFFCWPSGYLCCEIARCVSLFSSWVLLRVAEFEHLFGLREEQDFLIKLQHPHISLGDNGSWWNYHMAMDLTTTDRFTNATWTSLAPFSDVGVWELWHKIIEWAAFSAENSLCNVVLSQSRAVNIVWVFDMMVGSLSTSRIKSLVRAAQKASWSSLQLQLSSKVVFLNLWGLWICGIHDMERCHNLQDLMVLVKSP